jgi:cobalt-zinc-cadmium efflux system membrane fusion protein
MHSGLKGDPLTPISSSGDQRISPIIEQPGYVTIDSPQADLTPIAPRRHRTGLGLVMLGLVLGVAADRSILGSRDVANLAPQPEPALASRPISISRIGDRLFVPDGSPLRSRLMVEGVQAKDVARSLVLPAMVEADPARTVKVLPPVSGRVIELKVQLGGRVTQGQELAVIDSGDLAQVYADIEKARATLKLARQALDRQLALEKAGGAAVKDREQAQNDHAQAAAELERAESRLRAMGIPADQTGQSRLLSLKAPVSGSVIDLQAAPGAFLNDSTATIMTIANLDTVWVTANVPEKNISFVYIGQTVNVTFPSYPDKIFNGRVLFVSDIIEPDTRRNKVRIEFQNPDKAMKPNMFADATFVAPPVSQITVPTSALMMTNDRTSVFVEVADWAFERRNVEISYQDGQTAVVRSGLQPGERIVVRGGVRLND